MIRELSHDIDLSDPLDTAIFTIATIAFYSQLQLGEICGDHEAYTIFNHKALPTFANLKPPHTPAGSCMMHIPWTKVKCTKGDDVLICQQRDITDPVAALDHHLQINNIMEPDIAIVSYLTPDNNWKLLTTSKFMKQCNEIWQAHGHT